ncbi:MAG TPA: hypothetical protein VFQ79_08325 [Bryobacteraceae bacterium]|nr:hypothetical protein [Bryobacteraceae bacterium]
MSADPLHIFDPRRTVQLQGFSGRAATTTLHDATAIGFQLSGIFQAAEDFANIQLFSAYDYFNHLRVKPLPVTDLSGLTLQYDMEILPVNGEEGNVRPDCVRYASVGWDKLTITTGAGDIYEIPLMHHAQIVSGDYDPGGFGFSLHDRDADTLDELLVGKPTPALTDKAYVYFMGTRWSCSSAEAIAFCNLETRLLNNISAPDVPSCEQAIWWQEDPNFWHYLRVNNDAAGIQEADATDATDIASRLASMVGISSYLVDCIASGNVITVTLEPGVNGPVQVSTNSRSAPATLSRSGPGIYTAQVASSSEIRVGDYVGIDIGSANDEVVKVLAVGPGTFTAYFTKPHYGRISNIQCRVLPRARHFGRVLKECIADGPLLDYGEQPNNLTVEQFTMTNTSCELRLRLVGQLGEYGRDANGMPVRASVDSENKIVRIEKNDDEFGATSIATAVEGAGNSRAYRFTLPFPLLSGYLNGNRNSLVPVPAGNIVKVHLTFAPRFEDVEAGLAVGGLLKEGVSTSPAGTEEEWRVADAEAMLAGLKYYVGTANAEERITCLANFGLVQPDLDDTATWYYRLLVRRGEDSSMPQAWPPGTRIQRISTITGTRSDIEWQVRISNIAVTGDRSLKVGGDAPRIEESDGRCRYEGFWENYAYGASWPTQWWSRGHARRCAPNDAQDQRAVTIRYSYPSQHDLYLGTWLGRDAGRIQVVIDGGAPLVHDLYLNDYNGLAAMKKLAAALPGGTHTVEIRALFDKHPASNGYYFYFDYLWPLEPQDPPDPPKVYNDVSLAIDFDTDHGYKKPPAWHVWHLKKLGFLGHADVYLGVFWNNKRRRIEATYPNCTASIGGWRPDEPLWINLSGTTLYFAPGTGLETKDIAAHLRAMINVTFPGVWCTSDGGSIHIRSRAPSYTFTISASPQLSVSQGTGTYPKVTVDGKGRVTAGTNLAADDLPTHAHSAGDIVSGEFPHKIQKDGDDVGTRGALNLVQGNRISLATADDPANDRVSMTISASPPEAGEITNALGYVPANRTGEHFTGPIDCGPHQTIGGPLENMAKHSEDFAAAVWDKNGGSCSVTSNAIIAPDGNQTADVVTVVTTTPVIQQQIAGLADSGTYTFYIRARVASGTRKVSIAIVDNPYAAYLAGPTQIMLTTAWQRFKITGTLASGQTGLWIVVRQFAANGDDWTTGAIHLWGTCLQHGDDPQKAYARAWASQTLHSASGIAAGPTVIAASDTTTSPLKIHGPGSNLADSTLLELTANGELILAGGSGNGYRFAELAAANNPSGWAGVLKVKTPAGTTLGYILLHTNP